MRSTVSKNTLRSTSHSELPCPAERIGETFIHSFIQLLRDPLRIILFPALFNVLDLLAKNCGDEQSEANLTNAKYSKRFLLNESDGQTPILFS